MTAASVISSVSISPTDTVYDNVVYENQVGTLILSEDKLRFQTPNKVSILPWKKVVKRQVTSSSSTVAKPMFKLILRSGTQAIFQMEDRICLEVLRDDLGERLKLYRKNHPEEKMEDESVAVNKTRASFSDRRTSTPYSMSESQKEYVSRRHPSDVSLSSLNSWSSMSTLGMSYTPAANGGLNSSMKNSSLRSSRSDRMNKSNNHVKFSETPATSTTNAKRASRSSSPKNGSTRTSTTAAAQPSTFLRNLSTDTIKTRNGNRSAR